MGSATGLLLLQSDQLKMVCKRRNGLETRGRASETLREQARGLAGNGSSNWGCPKSRGTFFGGDIFNRAFKQFEGYIGVPLLKQTASSFQFDENNKKGCHRSLRVAAGVLERRIGIC